MLIAVAAAGCSGAAKKERAADNAVAARNYTPPAVTSRLDYGNLVDRRFRRLDRNGDDQITRDELPGGNPERILSLDVDGDGKVSEQEYSQGMMKRFDAHDLNKDGTVTTQERQAAR